MYGLADLVQAQFLLARHGVTYSESSALAIFEFDALVNLAVKQEQSQMEMLQAQMAVPRLGAKRH